MEDKTQSEPVTKGDLKQLEDKLHGFALQQTQTNSRLEQKIDSMTEKMDKVYSAVMEAFEKTVIKGKKYDQKALTHGGMLQEQEYKLQNHEKRLISLESR